MKNKKMLGYRMRDIPTRMSERRDYWKDLSQNNLNMTVLADATLEASCLSRTVLESFWIQFIQ